MSFHFEQQVEVWDSGAWTKGQVMFQDEKGWPLIELDSGKKGYFAPFFVRPVVLYIRPFEDVEEAP